MRRRTGTGGPRGAGRRAALLAVAVLALLLAGIAPAKAAPGDLDPSFNGGTVQGPIGGGRAVALQADGKLVVAGDFETTFTNFDFRVVRYNADGTLDPTFGTGGIVTTDVTSSDHGYAVAVQDDGKIVVAGWVFSGDPGESWDFALLRYNSNGTLDTGFDGDGKVVTAVGSETSDLGRALTVAGSPAKILVAGYSDNDFAVVRYNANGSLDTSFDGDGKVTTDLGGGDFEGASDIVVQPDGKVVVSGCAGNTAPNLCDQFALARYGSNGALDPGFGVAGKVVGPAGARGGRPALALQPDGKLVAAGHTGANEGTVAVVRYNADGSLDPGFDGDGAASGPAGQASDVALQADGRIVVAGNRSGDFLVARYNADGTLDPTFGTGGDVTTDFGPDDGAGASGLVIQPDGRIVAAGDNIGYFALARYLVTGGGEVADVAVSLADSPDPVASGGNLTYTVAVANAGPEDASGVELTHVLPPGADFVSATPSQGLCTFASAAGTLTCSLNGIVAGDSAGVSVMVSAGPPGAAATTASVATSSTDPNPANNSAAATTAVRPGAGAWTAIPGLGGPRSAPAAVLPDGRVLMAGGVGGGPLATAEIYDPVTRTSTATGSLASARAGHTLTTLADGRVLAAGGTLGFSVLGSAEIWNPATGTWTATGPMATGHSGHTAVRLDSGRVLVVGGIDLTGSVCPGAAGVPNSAEVYDPTTSTWAPTTGNARWTRIRGGTTTKLGDGRVLAVGGYLGSNYVGACNTAQDQNAPPEVYTPTSNSWSPALDNLAVHLNKHTATLQDDGTVLVAGGSTCNATCPTTSALRYNATTNQWTPRAQLPLGRSGHEAVRLSNGRTLVSGGEGGQGPYFLRSAVLYNPVVDTWSPAGLMATGRSAPGTGLSFGRSLVLGGQNSSTRLSSVELWTPRHPVTDLDGDVDTDRAVYRGGAWYAEGQPAAFLGAAGDIPVPADYDGDGDADHAVYRAGTWYADGASPAFFGTSSDVPVPADYDGDGKAERAVYRPSVGGWFIDGQATVFHGLSTDIPVPADYDGDGDADPAVYRPSVGGWYVLGQPTQFVGLSSDVPVPGDFDGDGDVERGIWRPSVGGWYVEGLAPVFVGLNEDVPVPGDYDGDGDAERGIWRPAVGGWYVDGQPTVFLGLSGDVPLPLPQAVYRQFLGS